MRNLNKLLSVFLFTGLLFITALSVTACDSWMSNDNFMSEIESEVHDANAAEINVYIRYANAKMGSTEPSGNTRMKVDVASKISAITSDDYGFIKWAAFSTEDFATTKQHSNLIFINEDDYNTNFKDKELPSSVVKFSNDKSPSTEVKVLSSRTDVFIIPIVTNRPTYVQSVPANADYNVVKNTSIRILFSKPLDESTIYDSEGNLNYSITTSSATLNDDEEIEAKDITDFFSHKLSDSGKMLTLKLNEEEDEDGNKLIKNLLDNRQRITVILYEGLCDRYGFSMNGNYTFSFQTGTNTDTLAPIIEVLVGGPGDICTGFVSFHDGEIDGKATTAAKNAPKDINSTEYTDALLAQRVKDKLNIYVKANDIIASGNTDINPAKDLSEDNVNYIAISASLYIENTDEKGNPVTANRDDLETTIPKKNNIYIPGTISANAEINNLFTEIVPLDKNGTKYSGGTIYTYDISGLPDGLIKIDVWGIDMTGNSGGDKEAGAAYYTKHDNGYKSIFVVKDSTPINSDLVRKNKLVKSKSEAAPYGWYNSETLGTMQLFDTAQDKIVDSGNQKLRSLDNNLFWSFIVGKNSSTPDVSSKDWVRIHSETSGESLLYSLKNAKAAQDGPVDITLYLKDDMGNISEPVVLDSIMYDNTKPTVKLLDNYGDFVDANGNKALHSSKDAVISQILKVAFEELNEDDNGSGIRRLEIHVKKDNTEVAVPLDSQKFKVVYADSTIENPTPSSTGIREIKIASDDQASTNNLKAFNVTDASKITTGTLFIYGLTLGEDDGDYTVTVDLFDSAMNKTTTSAKTLISRDTTAPVVNKVKVLNAQSRTVYGDATAAKTWWMPKDYYDENKKLTKVSLNVEINESGSGLEYIKVADDIGFTTDTKLKRDNNYLVAGKDYSLDTSNNTIRLLDNYTAALKGSPVTPIVITLENVELKKINDDTGNKLHLHVDDFVNNSGSNIVAGTSGSNSQFTVYYPDETTGTLIFADNTAPVIAALKVEDTANTTTNMISKAYDKDHFTDKKDVVLTLTLTAEELSKGSGIKTIYLSDNAVFTAATKIFVDGIELTNGYDFSADKKSVNFDKVFTSANVIKFTNVQIVSDTEGAQVITAGITDFVGLKSENKNSNTIIYDVTKPKINDNDGINWVEPDTGVTLECEGDWVVDTQKLKINFTEVTSGVKLIKFSIHLLNNTTDIFENPFDSGSDFKLYYNDVEQIKGTDYSIDSNKQFIVLTTPKTSGSFKFENLKLTNTNIQGTYVIDVDLLDAAGNTINCSKTIAIDSIPPELNDKLIIPGVINAKELIVNGGSQILAEDIAGCGNNWLKYADVGGTDKAADSIPVLITIEEQGSGIKVITFGENAVLDNNRTQLWAVDEYGNPVYDLKEPPAGTAAKPYTVNSHNKTITIDNSIDALNANGDNLKFKVMVKNVGIDIKDTETKVSKNKISVKVQDVAMHETGDIDTYESYIYSDSRMPATPTDFKLIDRAYSKDASIPTIAASENYTNETIVDMEFKLDGSEKTGSGYHEFRISGARFTDNSVISMTSIDGNEAVLCNGSAIPFVLSEDKMTLTLKTTGTNAENYVVRQAVKVKITNVELTNGIQSVTSGTEREVLLTAYDLIGRYNSAASDKIWFDNTPPELEKIFTANYSSSSYSGVPSYYVPTINVYPHANDENGTGVLINYGTETNVPTFYTATTYNTGFYQYNGQVSSSSSSLNTNFTHGAVLGIRAKDTTKLGGYFTRKDDTAPKTFLYYSLDSNFSKTKSALLTSGTNLSSDKRGSQPTATDDSEALWFGFTTGKYSAVIVDEAGNCSEIFHFAVVQDTTKPAKEWGSGSNADSLNNRVLLQMPDNSAKAYTNSAITVANSNEFRRFWACSSSAYSIRTKKYVTKKTSNKYKIQLNLGGTYTSATPITKIDGSEASTTTSYSDLSSTISSSPIEMYAISTFYGSWPTSADGNSTSGKYKYSPVVPKGTTFPSGQSHSSSSTSYLGKDYFEYGDCPTSNSWYIYETDVSYWHSYSSGTTYTDTFSCNSTSISSYVDSNNNLIIEIPNTHSTAPISVFLRDGCGNMQYVVCGVYTDSDTDSSSYGQEVAISFVVDEKLGYAETTNGMVATPIIMQNPYMTYVTSSPSVAWPLSSGSTGFTWNHNTGNGDQGGEGTKRGFIKDYAKYATYYNPNIDYSNTAQQFKIGLTLNYDTRSYKRDYPEDILFNTDLGKVTDPEPLSSDSSKSDYTCRALLYCTQNSSKPTYDEIISAGVNVKNSSGGFRTAWVGVKSSNDTSLRDDSTEEDIRYKVTGTTILLDYPRPDYTALGWTINETNGEPKPYYIWYIFEDRVGNYEIAKIVNSNATGNQLTTETSGMFDRWLYDNEAPVVTTRGHGLNPNEITADNIAELVASNNGFVPYVDSDGNVYVHASKTHTSLQNGATLNSTAGNGTTHKADGHETYSIYNNFVDLVVSENTGVRAFAWSTSNNVNFSTSFTDSSSWYTGSNVYWYVGWGPVTNSGGLAKDIANGSFTYGSSSYKPENAYYYGSTDYSGKYSGTKVNTVFPYGKLSTSTGTELWLHVMDWTGNISHYRMGASGVKFINDSVAPSYTTSTAEKLETGQYYIKKTASTPLLKIAGAGEKAINEENIDVYIPEEYFAETGSGIKGYSFSDDGTGIAEKIGGKSYLSIPYNRYHGLTSDTYYVYDNVGNVQEHSLNYDFDNKPPKIASVAFVTKLDSSGQGKFADVENGLGTQGVYTSFGGVRFYEHKEKNSDNEEINKYYDDISHFKTGEVQEIYITKENAVKFQINFDSEIKTENEYLDDIKINRWDSDTSKWVTVTSWKSNNTSWWLGEGETESTTVIRAMGTSDSSGYDKLTYTAEGTYYQILATDISGNSNCQYFKLYLDKAAPTFATTTPNPIVTLGKGSIGKIGSTYYYTADNTGKLKLNFAVVDSGIGSVPESGTYAGDLKKIWYSLTGTEDSWTLIEDSANAEIQIASGDIETIYFKDALGNVTSGSDVYPGFAYTNPNAATGTDPKVIISKLNFYGDDTVNEPLPSAPFIEVGEIKKDGKRANIVKQITTYGMGYSDTNLSSKSTTDLDTHVYTEQISAGTVLIKGEGDEIRKRLTITFPTSNNKIIGYLRLNDKDENGNTLTPSTTAGIYSLKTLEHEFTEILPTGEDDDYSPFTIKYYAVDIVGNVSPALKIIYSYENPHKAKDIRLIEDPEHSDLIKTDVLQQMHDDHLTFAKFLTVPGSTSGNQYGKPGIRYFDGGYLIVRCSLFDIAGDEYLETPSSIELWDIWGTGKNERKKRGVSDTGAEFFKIYTSALNTDSNPANDDKVGGTTADKDRYYCYVAFKLKYDEDQDSEKTPSSGCFKNNDDFDGSNIYFKLCGETSSDYWLMYKSDDNDTTKKYGWKIDDAAPMIDSAYVRSANNGIKGYRKNGSIEIAYDNYDSGWNYKTNYYSKDMIIYIPQTKITEKYNGIQYKTIVTGGATDIDSGWKNLDTASIKWKNNDFSNTDCYSFELPNVATIHSSIQFYLKDEIGNVSEYIVGNPDHGDYTWWIVNDCLTSVSVAAPAEGWSETAEKFTFDVSIPSGSVIKSVKAKVGGEEIASTVTFNDYNKGNDTDKPIQPTLDGEQGWLNISGIKVSIDKSLIVKGWNAKDVTIILNNNDELKGSVKKFVPAKPLGEGNISINTGENAKSWISGTTEYVLPIAFTGGAGIDNVSSIEIGTGENTAEGVTVEWTSGATTVTIKNVPAQIWSDQKVYLKINGTITKEVFTIQAKALNEGNISINTDADTKKTWESGTTEYVLSITFTDGAGIENVTSIEIGTGDNAAEGVTAEWSSGETTVTIKNIPAQIWSDQKVYLKINGTITKEVFTVPAIALGEANISINTAEDTKKVWVSETTEYVLPITFTGGAGIDNVSSIEIGTGENAAEGVTAEWTSGETTVTIKNVPGQNWNDQKVYLKINETITKEVFTIPAKELTADDIEIASATWNDSASYELHVTLKNGATVNNITAVSAYNADAAFKEENVTVNKTVVVISGMRKLWDGPQTVSVKFNNNESIQFNVLTIPQREIKDSDVTITPTNPETWSDNLSYVGFTVTLSEGLTITKIDIDGNIASVQDNYGGNYGLQAAGGTTIAKTVTVKVITNHGEVEKAIFPILDSNAANPNVSGRSVLGLIKDLAAKISNNDQNSYSDNNIRRYRATESELAVNNGVTEKSVKEAKKAAKKAKKTSKKASKKTDDVLEQIVTQTQIVSDKALNIPEVVLTDDVSVSKEPDILENTDSIIKQTVEETEVITAIEPTVTAAAEIEPAEQSADTGKSSSKSAAIVIMLAILASFGGFWYYKKGRKN